MSFLVQEGVLATGPAGLLERASFLVGFIWITVAATRLIRVPESTPTRS